jgi:ankyrin repeat protein
MMKKFHNFSMESIRLIIFLLLYLTSLSIQAGEIHDAAAAGDLNKVQSIITADPCSIESKDENGSTPLHIACIRNQVAVANFLIDQGANVNARNKWGQTPLHWANGVFGQDYDLIKRLIAKGADVNAQGNRGESVLQWAAGQGNLKVAELLINSGADLNAYDKNFGTILHNIISLNNIEMAKLLIDRGAKLNLKDPLGYTEIHLAAIVGDSGLVRLLIEHGADIQAVDGHNHTALYYAAKHGYQSVAEALVANGAKKNDIVESNYGKAPQLAGTFKDGEAYLWYLGKDGYAVKTKEHLLLFDPPGIDESLEAGLANGHLNPGELAGQKITVLITKPDWERYELGVLELAKRTTGVDIAISFTPETKLASQAYVPPYQLAEPNQSFSLGDIRIHTIPATLGGMGYLIEADGLRIFHAGYHVCNEASQTENYRKEIDFLKPFGPIDVAVLPVSGHLITSFTYDSYLYLLDQLSPKAVYLMHGYYEYEQYAKCAELLRTRNVPVEYPENAGDRFHFPRD